MSILGINARSFLLDVSLSKVFPGSTKGSSKLARALLVGEGMLKGFWPHVLDAAEELTDIPVTASWGRWGLLRGWERVAALWNPGLLFSPQAVPAVTPVDEESSDGEPDQEAVQR